MKKFGIIYFMAILAAFGLNSCGDGAGSTAQDRAIADKIENGEELTSEDYSHIINYVGEFAQKAQPYAVETSDKASEEMANLRSEYAYLATFRSCLETTPVDKLSDDDLKEIGKYAGLIEFSVPIGYTLTTNPDAAGIEVAVPDSANGVIANVVDTVAIDK